MNKSPQKQNRRSGIHTIVASSVSPFAANSSKISPPISRRNLSLYVRSGYRNSLGKSKSEIRRLIKGNAVKINDKVISDEKLIVTNKLFNENYLKLSIGKKRHIKIELD